MVAGGPYYHWPQSLSVKMGELDSICAPNLFGMVDRLFSLHKIRGHTYSLVNNFRGLMTPCCPSVIL